MISDFNVGAFASSLPFTLLAVVVVLGLTFLMALRLGRHSVVDVAWGLGFVAVAGRSYALSTGDGDPGRPGYAEYVRRTSGFFPLPPKRRHDA